MVHKNAKIGNVSNITLIELGEGDVMVAAIHCKVNKYVGVEFVNDSPKPIGTKHNTAGTTTDNSRPEAILTFTKIESIEVIERALAKAKILLRNIKNKLED